MNTLFRVAASCGGVLQDLTPPHDFATPTSVCVRFRKILTCPSCSVQLLVDSERLHLQFVFLKAYGELPECVRNCDCPRCAVSREIKATCDALVSHCRQFEAGGDDWLQARQNVDQLDVTLKTLYGRYRAADSALEQEGARHA